jgi:cytochrome b6-f complex iron-sulfur subunit
MASGQGPSDERHHPVCDDEDRLRAEAERMGVRLKGRRGFLELFLGTGLLASLASFLYPVFRYVIPPPSPDLGSQEVVAAKVGELKANMGKIFRFGSKPALLVMMSGGEYRAISATCTHLDCTVQYRADKHDVWCACHNGVYDLNGRNVSGPPPRPLQTYEVHIKGDEIVVVRGQEA